MPPDIGRMPGGGSPYNQGYQAPPRQMNQGGGFRQQFQPPQQQKQGGGFWRGLGNAIKAPFTGGGSTTNNYYGGGGMNQGMNQGMMRGGMNRGNMPPAWGQMKPPMGGFQQQLRQGGQMNPGMQKPPMGQQPQWNPTNMFTPGNSSEYLNRAKVNPWMGNAPGMQPGGGNQGPRIGYPEEGMQRSPQDFFNSLKQGGYQNHVMPKPPGGYGPEQGMDFGNMTQGGIGPSQDMMQGQMGQYDPNYRSPMQGGGYQDPRFQSMM